MPRAEAVVDVAVVRVGRQRTVAEATLSQDGATRLRSVAAMSDPIEPTELHHRHPVLDPPSVPSPEDCIDRADVAQGVSLPILDSLEIRVHPDFVATGEAGGSDLAEVTGWIRFRDGRPPDLSALGLFCDAFPPPVFALLGAEIGWVPTLELTVHVRRRPAPGWILARLRSGDIDGDHIVEDGELWDTTGALVARSRQLALLLPR